MEDNHPHVALGAEEVHDHLALVELDVEVELDELVEELEELDVVLAVGSSSLGFLLEGLPLDCSARDCGWRWLDLILEGHVVPQELVLHVVVVEDVEPWRLVQLDVDALILRLGDVDVVVLELVQKDLGLVEDDVLSRRLALVDGCREEDCEMHAGLDARLVEECSMLVYLSRRRCRRNVDLSGSVLSMKKLKEGGSPTRRGFRPSLHRSLACARRACCRSSPWYVARSVASRWQGCRCVRS